VLVEQDFAEPVFPVPTPIDAVRHGPEDAPYHAVIEGENYHAIEALLEADHRRHAEIENAIRDLKYGMGLNHLPSGKFGANGAWLAVQVIAHDIARWTARLGLGAGIVTTKTLRRRLFGLVGRLTRSARRPADASLPGALALGRRVRSRPRAPPGDPAARLTARRLLATPGAGVSLG
jgi:hypothetical protein